MNNEEFKELRGCRLVVIYGEGESKDNVEFTLDAPEYFIGRAPNCAICLRSRYVGRVQAKLVRKERKDESYYYQIIDSDIQGKPSLRGLLINGKKVLVHDLKNEDEIVFSNAVKAKYYTL